jgi:hypothetical protein
MPWLDAIRLAQMHREIYVAILKSWVPHGLKGEFAHRAGITRQYLSYLCVLEHEVGEGPRNARLPSQQTAHNMAEALPAPAEVRNSLLENMALAHTNAARAFYTMTSMVSQRQLIDLISEITQLHQRATFGRDKVEVRRSYQVLRDAAAQLLPTISLERNPISFVQTCLCLHDAQCILDRADDALRYAKLAGLVFENFYVYETGYSREQIDGFEINTIRGEAVAYHNLGLDKMVGEIFERACKTSAYRNAGDLWKPWLARDYLCAVEQTPRFSIRKAGELVRNIYEVCDRTGDEFALFMVREPWLRCLIAKEKLNLAKNVFQEELERITRLPQVGFLHRALLLKSGAQLAWKLKDMQSWQEMILKASSLMQQAGLIHQFRLIRELYGDALMKLLADRQDVLGI